MRSSQTPGNSMATDPIPIQVSVRTTLAKARRHSLSPRPPQPATRQSMAQTTPGILCPTFGLNREPSRMRTRPVQTMPVILRLQEWVRDTTTLEVRVPAMGFASRPLRAAVIHSKKLRCLRMTISVPRRKMGSFIAHIMIFTTVPLPTSRWADSGKFRSHNVV